MSETFVDDLVGSTSTGLPVRFFDRFMFNLHPRDAIGPSLIVGAGVYPGTKVVDGFLVAVIGDIQRNLRFSTELRASTERHVGPFSWTVEEPMRRWRLRLADNLEGVELEAVWTARAPAWDGDVTVRDEAGAVSSSFEHLFQSGTYAGTLTIDGDRQEIDGWYGQRDRSRGVRTMSGGQGLHLWVQPQFRDRSVGFLLVEDRKQRRLLLEGAVMHADGRLDPVVDVRHDLVFDEKFDLRSGRFVVTTASGAREELQADAGSRGGYMAGGGYGGHHGRAHGRDHLEHDEFALDGSVGPSTVDTPLTDRVARFADAGGVVGVGVLEFAHSRSSSYVYQPSL